MGRIINKTTRRYKGIPPGEIQKKHELKAIVIPPKSLGESGSPASKSRFEVSPEAIEEHIFKRWNGVFERLAK